jgi:hypothetical protein
MKKKNDGEEEMKKKKIRTEELLNMATYLTKKKWLDGNIKRYLFIINKTFVFLVIK